MTIEVLREYCEGKLAHYKIPRYLHLTDEFPMTVTGKIQKYKMREQAIADLGLDAAARTPTAFSVTTISSAFISPAEVSVTATRSPASVFWEAVLRYRLILALPATRKPFQFLIELNK